MMNWIAGNWNEPFKCIVSHAGIFDTRGMGYMTEELWFSEWENGGTPWEAPQNYEKYNPAGHVANWSKPMLVIAGQLDYRVPYSQSLSMFNALQRRGIPEPPAGLPERESLGAQAREQHPVASRSREVARPVDRGPKE